MLNDTYSQKIAVLEVVSPVLEGVCSMAGWLFVETMAGLATGDVYEGMVIAAAVVGAMVIWWRMFRAPSSGRSLARGPWVWLVPIAVVLAWVAGEAFATSWWALHPADVTESTASTELTAWAIAYVAVAAPLIEELSFRGLMFDVDDRHALVCAAVSSVLFAASHLSVAHVVLTVALGMALGALRICSRRVWPCVIAHCAFNSATLALSGAAATRAVMHLPMWAAVALGCASVALSVTTIMRGVDHGDTATQDQAVLGTEADHHAGAAGEDAGCPQG